MKINEYSENIQHLQLNAGGGNLLPNLHKELSDLSGQLSDCLDLWMSYFKLTQTRFHQLFRQCTYSRTKLIEAGLIKHRQCLIDLHQTVHRLQIQHQEGINRLLEHYLNRLAEGESYCTFVPYANNDEVDSVFIGYSAMYYSTTHLAENVLTLGKTIHTIFELEITHLYQPF
jgi:hypothetical protein